MGGWDLSTCNNVKIITQGRDGRGTPLAPPYSLLRFSVSLKERGATETRAHLNDTSYWAFVGIQETPLRILGFCLSTAYHTWLGKASRSQTLSERLPTKSDPVCLGFWECVSSAVWLQHFYIYAFFPPLLCLYDWMPQWMILPILFCELPARSQWISYAACHAFSHLLSAVVFFLQFST